MRKRYLHLPISVNLNDLASSINKTGRPYIHPKIMDEIRKTHGQEELERIYDLTEMLRTFFYMSKNDIVKKD